jgi:hypothetical protein
MENLEEIKKLEGIKEKKTTFEAKIKPVLTYVGSIGAGAMAIAYIVLMFVMVLGFKAQNDFSQALTFAIVNAVVGFIIMQLLKVQGVDFAKQQNTALIEKYSRMLVAKRGPKKKKLHTMKHFWITTVLKDALVKGVAVIISTSCIIYIVIEGSQDYNMLLLSVVNLIMFACFGLLSLVKAYDFFNDDYVPYMEDELNRYETEKAEREKAEKEQREQSNQICRENMERPDCDVKEQGNVVGNTTSGSNLLDSGMGPISISDYIAKPMVLYNHDSGNCVLGRTVHTGDSTSDSVRDVPGKSDEQKEIEKGEQSE